MPRFLPLIALLAAAAILRLHDLPGRVMHTDEAVHAVIVGHLLAGEPFVYNPHDFHGPTLHYSTLALAALRGQTGFQELDESTLRGVPAFYGLLLVLIAFAFRRELGRAGTWFAAWLTAISPMMVFFSRYYIMELPFAVFLTTLGLCCWRYCNEESSRRRKAWAAGVALSLGLLHATKETFVIHVAAMALAAVLAGGRTSLAAAPGFLRRNAGTIALTALGAFAISAALLSHGFQRPEAIADGIRTYLLYLQRAEGSDAGHGQPWYYYFAVLFFLKPAGGFWYSEIAVLLLGLAGAALAFFRPVAEPGPRIFLRALALYTLATMVFYSLIPYKTPWSFLGTMHGLLLLSAHTLARLVPDRGPANHPRRAMAAPAAGVLLLTLTTFHALLYNRQIISVAPAAPEQPMIYGHTSNQILELTRTIQRLETSEGHTLSFWVADTENGWPLPWYRRKAIGHNRYGKSLPPLDTPPDILAVSPDRFPDAAQALFATHQARTYELRPGVNLHVFFRRDLTGLREAPAPVLHPSGQN